MADWYRQQTKVVLQKLNVTSETGLSPEEAAARLAQHGPNELEERGGTSPFAILIEQFSSTIGY